MRLLAALLLIAAPLLAQEPGEAERRAEEEHRAAVERELAAEKAAYEKRAAELKRQAEQRSKWGKSAEEVTRLIEELRSNTAATREQAMEELKSVNATLEELLPILADAMRASEEVRTALVEVKAAALPNTIVVGALGGPGGGEAITGSADGTDYTLKSLGDGRYELNAQKKDADGRLMEKWVEQGTLAELRQKHAFLKGALAVQWQAPALQALRGRVALDQFRGWQAAAPAAGLLVANGQSAAWDGGGRVGVSVLKPSEDLRFHLQLPEGAGFIVQQVVPGSRAEQVGIRRMDVLLKLDGELIDSPIQLKKLHEKTGVLEILRRSEAKKIDLSAFPEWKPLEAPAAAAVAVPDAPAGAR